MSGPCNYDEAWGGLITSNRVPVIKKKMNAPPKFNIPIDKSDTVKKRPDKSDNIACSEFLLHFITCKHCQYKIKELSNTYMFPSSSSSYDTQEVNFNSNSGAGSFYPKIGFPFAEQTHSRTPRNSTELNYISNGEEKLNETLLYILIGLMIGYILSQIISKR